MKVPTSTALVPRLMKKILEPQDPLSSPTACPRPVPAHLLRPLRNETQWVSLPPPRTATRDIKSALSGRISHRTFAEDFVPLDAVGTCLAAAMRGDVRNWRDEHEAGNNLELLLLALRVQGLVPGLYRYCPSNHALVFVAGPVATREVEQFVLQREFSRAPAVVAVTGNLAAALDRHGRHGYRQLLLRAGAAAHYGYLAVLGLELGGCLFAGLLMKPLRELANLDGYREAPLFALSFGSLPAVSRTESSRG